MSAEYTILLISEYFHWRIEMAEHYNAVTGCNISEDMIPAYSTVAVGGEITASGFEDDLCLGISAKSNFSRIMPGVATCDIYPLMAGRVITSGLATTKLPEFLDPGDCIMPDGNGGWELSESGSVKVVTPADKAGYGIVQLGSSNSATPPAYEGQFSVKDRSEDDVLKILAYGGETDLGTVYAKEFVIEEDTRLYLMAEYVRTNDKSGYYKLALTANWEKDKVSSEYALWLIADIYVQLDKQGKNCLKTVQQWQNGEIHFGTRFWI